jgi:hypothetical protein
MSIIYMLKNISFPPTSSLIKTRNIIESVQCYQVFDPWKVYPYVTNIYIKPDVLPMHV